MSDKIENKITCGDDIHTAINTENDQNNNID